MAEFGRRILILVPHPDDEVVACAATIRRAQQAGAKLFAFFLTNGCIARENLWPWQRKSYDANVMRRQDEAARVAQELGLTVAGFAQRPSRSLRHCLSEVHRDIRHAITTLKIDQLWVPAYEGGHADHDILNAIASRLATHVSVLEFAEYNFVGGKPLAQTFPFPNGSEQHVELTPQEQEAKKALLRLYVSEQKNLDYVGTTRECYRPLATYDYSHPPHGGTVWYARFHWVPFAHPRIDFTKPKEVCQAITRWMES